MHLDPDHLARAIASLHHAPVAVHPDAQLVAAHNRSWLEAQGLVDDRRASIRAAEIQTAALAARIHARHRRALVELAADLIAWLFLFDDAIGEAPAELDERGHRAKLRSFELVLRGTRLPSAPGPFHGALLDLLERARALGADHSWIERFGEDMCGYFSGCADETRLRASGRAPSLASYRQLRVRTIGTRPCFALIELGLELGRAASQLRRPELVEVRARAACLTAWVNDLYSCPKELAAGDPLNLVVVLAAHEGTSLEQACARASALYERELGELEHIVARLRSGAGGEAIAPYLDGLLDWVHANCVWTRLCGRYEWHTPSSRHRGAQARSRRTDVHADRM